MGGVWVHRQVSYDETTGIMVCSECGPVKARRRDSGRNGVACENQVRTTRTAAQKRRGGNAKSRARTQRHKKDHCERAGCTSVIVDPCQLEVDHIDGNPRNNKIENFQTLCANCHRLKTYRPDLLQNDE